MLLLVLNLIRKTFDCKCGGLHKIFPTVYDLNENKLYDDDPQNASIPDYLKKDFIMETGDAEGVDVSFKYEFKQFYFWAVY